MSDDTLNAAIAAKWESAGLDATNDSIDVPDVDEDQGESDSEDVDTSDEADSSDEADTSTDDAADDTDTAEVDDTETTEESEEEPASKSVDAPADETKAAAEEQKEIEDDLAAELGLGKPPADPKKRAQWWKKQLPYSLIHKTVVAREQKLKAAHEGVVKEHTGKVTEFETRFADIKTVEDIIKDKPDQYVKTLAALFPDTYGKMFAPIFGTASGEAKKLPEAEDPGPMPEPNYKLPDGNMTYDLDGLRAHSAWVQKVTQQETLKSLKPHLDFLDSQRTEAEKRRKQDEANELKRQGLETSEKALAEVKTWDLGSENIDAILAAAAKLDPRYDAVTALNIAYRQIVVPKLKANRDEMHAQIVKSLKKKSTKQTSAGLQQNRSTAPAVSDPAKTDLDTRIKNAWKRKGLI